MSEDLLANGFKDVGPTITKLTLNDKQLTKFIDEFIVYNYDSNCITASEGAFGIGDPLAPTPARPFGVNYTDFLLDGVGSQRIKKIDDVYLYNDWHKTLSEDVDQGDDYDGGLDLATCVGPNAELFSYLNPHPSMRGGSERWKTEIIIKTTDSATTTIHVNSTELLQVGELILTNNGVADGVTQITAINSSTSLTVSAAIDVVEGTALEIGLDPVLSINLRPVNLYNGHFYKKRPNAVALVEGDATQPGYVGLPGISEKIYMNEFSKVKRLITTSARGVTFMPAASTGVNTEAKLRHYKEERSPDGSTKHHFWISNYKLRALDVILVINF
ncbi:MAG: hypothetical protein EBY54_01905 [Proteobacteria bacterium]|nr:hypothetical protein [Pseudomonadota bacterium]